MAGAFFMATKRFAEYRSIGSEAVAAGYRKSFAHYNDNRLLVSMFFYITTCALFGGVFIVRYKLELILHVPFAAGFFAYYLHLGLKEHSAVQTPEKLYRERGFFSYAVAMSLLFVALMFSDVPALYEWFNVSSSAIEPLWRIGP
jgi:decaprenyl-phosphate phosphoribosyltransferase